MKKYIPSLVLSVGILFSACQSNTQQSSSEKVDTKEMKTEKAHDTVSLYDFEVNKIDGTPVRMSDYKGKKLMIVNTASECGLTPQYEQLQEVHQKYGSDDFVILGFPANNFGAQEPGTNTEIAGFCKLNYGVTFQMMEKISVKGDDMNPLYAWLTKKDANGVMDAEVKWNFQKFLINEEGKLEYVIPPMEKPDSERIINWITKGKEA